MAAVFFLFLSLWSCTTLAAPPPNHGRLYPQQGPPHLQQLNALDYYLDNQEVANFYNQPQQKQDAENSNSNAAPARLENLDNPDSEVEILPGAQPQQPPQQNPVSPNLPGILPGQRVFIVHMPIAGYRPGTVGGYQPVYVVAAAPNGNPNYVQGGYQNAILLDPSGQGLVSPFIGYPRPGLQQTGHPGFLVPGQSPIGLTSSYNLVYQDPAFGYQPAVQGASPNQQTAVNNIGQRQMHLSQLVSLAHPQAHVSEEKQQSQNSERSRVSSEASDSKEGQLTSNRNARPLPPHAQVQRNNA